MFKKEHLRSSSIDYFYGIKMDKASSNKSFKRVVGKLFIITIKKVTSLLYLVLVVSMNQHRPVRIPIGRVREQTDRNVLIKVDGLSEARN